MKRIETTLSALKTQGKKALIPYVMAGDSSPEVTVGLMHELVEAGADLIELGLPFSDPMADGPVIALAAERALAAGTSTRQVFDMVKAFRQDNSSTPVVLMGYLNSIEIMGYEAFVDKCADAGVDGVLMVDLPPEEAQHFTELLKPRGMDLIFLLAPTTTEARTKAVLEAGSGYIYYVSLKGVTGAANLDVDSVAAKVAELKSKTELPVCVGFGIRDAKSAKQLAEVADGVIVGSALVKHFADKPAAEAQQLACELVSSMRQALDQR